MNRFFSRIWLISVCILAGCSTHPLPKDVSNSDTFKIVKGMRCEAKFAVQDAVAEILGRSPSPWVQKVDPQLVVHRAILQKIAQEESRYPNYFEFNGRKQSRHNVADLVQLYSSSAISYDFTFEITENDQSSAGVGFRLPFANGVANFSAGGSLNKTRSGKREFTMVESFRDLAKLECGEMKDDYGVRNVLLPKGVESEKLRKNFIYPLTGSVGMDEIMENFIRLSSLGGGRGEFSDTIRFTTTASGNAGASVAMTPGPLDRLRLANAQAAVGASRTDIHEVIVTLAFPNVAAFLRLKRGPITELPDKKDIEDLREGAKFEAAVAQCIQKAEARENRFGTLRNVPPQVYCIRFARQVVQFSRE